MLLWLTCCALALNSYSQEKLKPLLDRVNNAGYIFEGQVIKTYSYWNKDSDKIYTSNVVQISRIFKGDLQCGTVELITNGGTVDDKTECNSHYINMSEGTTGIFLCGQNEKQLSPTAFYQFSNPDKLTMIFEQQSLIKYILEGGDWKAYDVTQKFADLAALYGYTDYLTQLNYVDCADGESLLNVPHATPAADTYRFPVYQRSNYDSLMAHLNQKISIASARPHVQRATKTLTYTIANPIITGTTTKYFEFDIDLTDDATGYYFNSAMARIAYPSAIFGSNLVGSNKIAVTRGVLISDTVTYDAPTPADIASNEIAIPMGINVSNLGSLNLSPITNAPAQAVHVKMEIQSCNLAGSVSFTNQSIMQLISYYGTYSNDTFGTNYDNIVATDSKAVPACQATITSVSPTTISAGIGDKITIRGYQFGAVKGNGSIMMLNAEDGGASKVILNTSDASWSDTAIVITVPSYNDTSMTSLGIIGRNTRSKVGSGPIWLITNSGDRDSTSPVTVFYSVTNLQLSNGIKYPQNLIKKDANGGYKFSVDSTIWNTPAIKACVYKAVADWKCLTGVSWTMDTVIYGLSDTAHMDGRNVIQFGYTGYSMLGIVDANTSTWALNCGTTIYTPEIDLVFNRSTPWWFDTTGTAAVPSGMADFYAAILHELGHGHSLNHVMDSFAVLYCYENDGPTPAAARKIVLRNDASCDYGGNKVMDMSIAATYGGCAALPIIPQYICTPFTGIFRLDDTKLELSTYPNPFSDNITIDYVLDRDCMMDLALVDVQGRVMRSYPYAAVGAGQHRVEMSAGDLSAGAYFINGHVNGRAFNQKIICIH